MPPESKTSKRLNDSTRNGQKLMKVWKLRCVKKEIIKLRGAVLVQKREGKHRNEGRWLMELGESGMRARGEDGEKQEMRRPTCYRK